MPLRSPPRLPLRSRARKEPREPQDMGFMYLRAFEDLDGHIWEIFWMDPKAVKKS